MSKTVDIATSIWHHEFKKGGTLRERTKRTTITMPTVFERNATNFFEKFILKI